MGAAEAIEARTMTDDPIKLFVVVMMILLAVLGFVTSAFYNQASALESAVVDAKRDAERLKEAAADVQSLCEQIGKGIGGGYRGLIARAAQFNNIKISSNRTLRDKPVPGGRGMEKRFQVQVTRGRTTSPINRDQIAKFCRMVENDSRGILKTIELKLIRATGRGQGKAGTEDRVVNDQWTVTVVFGLRVVN
ncbi:MAG: hypothetical protein ACYTGN_11430 [Planctomycetota bacterium]|jgi:hypothetical protein